MVEHNGTNGHNRLQDELAFTARLLAPVSKGAGSRRAWGIEVENTWVPYFTATNVNGQTHLAADVLGKPLRLARAKDGSIRFSASGRPVMRLARELNAVITTARENFVASLQQYTGITMEERSEEYASMVEAAQRAAKPIIDTESVDITEAMLLLTQNSSGPTPEDKPTAEAPEQEPAAKAPTQEPVKPKDSKKQPVAAGAS